MGVPAAPVGGGPGTLKLLSGCPRLALSMVDTQPPLLAPVPAAPDGPPA